MGDVERRKFTRANRGSRINSLLNSEFVDKNDFWASDEVTAIFAEDKDDEDYQVQCFFFVIPDYIY